MKRYIILKVQFSGSNRNSSRVRISNVSASVPSDRGPRSNQSRNQASKPGSAETRKRVPFEVNTAQTALPGWIDPLPRPFRRAANTERLNSFVFDTPSVGAQEGSIHFFGIGRINSKPRGVGGGQNELKPSPRFFSSRTASC